MRVCVIFQPRLRCLAHIVRKLENPVQFIQAIIPEVSATADFVICHFLSAVNSHRSGDV